MMLIVDVLRISIEKHNWLFWMIRNEKVCFDFDTVESFSCFLINQMMK